MDNKTRIQANLEEEFNSFASNYTEDMIKCVPYYLDLIEAFSTGYPQGYAPKNILDIGCGNGNATTQVMKLFPRANYILLDASKSMLDACKERFVHYNISCEQSYFKDFVFEPDQFGLVIAGFSLHHCDTKEKLFIFESIFNTLKSGGVFCSSDLMINKNNPDHQNLLASWKSFVVKNNFGSDKWEWLMEHYEEFDRPDNFNDQICWLENIGFKTIDTRINQKYWAHFKVLKP